MRVGDLDDFVKLGRSSALLLMVACQSATTAECRVERLATPLVGGTASVDYLELSASEERAVVALEFRLEAGVPDLCSGAVVASDVVLTAAHCFQSAVQSVRVNGTSWPRTGDRAFSIETLAERDVALVHLPDLGAPTYFAIDFEDPVRWEHARVEIAGAGVTEDGSIGRLRFAVAEVAQVADLYLAVEMSVGGGPCRGDSGGPLLVRDASGRAAITGVLSGGAASCEGPDEYVRLDGLRDWLVAVVGDQLDASRACGGLTERGRCFGNRAVWCESDEVRARDCDESEKCGFSEERDGYRCIDPNTDRCAGISDAGLCVEGTAIRCVDGALQRMACGDCGGICQISARSGKAACFTL